MARFLKLVGTHHRKENGKEVSYPPKSIIEATEEELRKHDPNLNTWQRLDPITEEEKEAEKEENKPLSLKVVRIENSKEFNVINTVTNEVLNDVPLPRKDAFALVKNLGKDESTE